MAKIVEGIQSNVFQIRTSAPHTLVSWQVTGVRQDPYAEANRIQVEVDKAGREVGHYLHPEAYGLGREFGLNALNESSQQTGPPRLPKRNP